MHSYRTIIRLITLIVASAVSLSHAMAESHYKPHISVGGHAGMSMGRVAFTPSAPQQWAQGLTMGVSARYAEERLVGVIGELNISQGGWKEMFEESPLQYTRKFTYVTLPILTHIYFGPPRFKCFFNLGPQLSYMIGESISSNFDYSNPTAAEGWPADPRMTAQMDMAVKNKFDYGITAGFGCEFWIKPRHSAYIEARYYYGLGNVFPSSKSDIFNASRAMTLAVTIGYNFRLK